jgi:predicted  nucleic acid-binding Zn-ribbon protein
VKNILYLSLNMSIYGYGELYGSGYRYPRRPRKAYIGKDQEKLWTRAAVFNTAIANKNPWVEFLRSKNFYDELRDKLRKLREEYYKGRPYTTVTDVQRKISQLEKQLDTLREERDVIERTAPELTDVYAGTKVAQRLPYAEAVSLTKNKLNKEINNINARIAELEAIKEQLRLAAKK